MSDCLCCQPPWEFKTDQFEPCGVYIHPTSYDSPCGFTSGWNGIDGSWDGKLYPWWNTTVDHRKIAEWRSNPFGITWWYPELPGQAGGYPSFGGTEWIAIAFLVRLKVAYDAGLNWTLELWITENSTLGHLIATWTKDNWNPFSTRAAGSFDIDDNPDDAELPDARITNWQIFDSALTYAQIQTNAVELKVAHYFRKQSGTWYLIRGDKGESGGVGSQATVDASYPFDELVWPVSTFYDGACGLPESINLTPTCFAAVSPETGNKTPCYKTLEDWTTGYLTHPACGSDTALWDFNGFDNQEFGPPNDQVSFWDFWHSGWDFSVTGPTYIRHNEAWWRWCNPTTDHNDEPGTNDDVWREFGGDWSAGTYYYWDWVIHNDIAYVCGVTSTTDEPGTSIDWTPQGGQLEKIKLVQDDCTGDCVATIYTPRSMALVYSLPPLVDGDDQEVECIDVELVDI